MSKKANAHWFKCTAPNIEEIMVTLPAEIKATPDRLFQIKPDLEAGLEVYWDTGDLEPGKDIDLVKLPDQSAAILIPSVVAKSRNYRIKLGAIVCLEKNKLDKSYTTVNLGDSNGSILSWLMGLVQGLFGVIGKYSTALLLIAVVAFAGLSLSTHMSGCHWPEPPGPTPDPGPTPTPTPTPIPAAGFRVLIVFDKAKDAGLAPDQFNAIYGKAMRDYLNAKCAVGPDGKTKEWRIWPAEIDPSLDPSKELKDAFKRPRQSVPWIVVSNGKDGFEGPLPATAADLTALLKKYEN